MENLVQKRMDVLVERLNAEEAEYLYGELGRRLYGEDHYREWLAKQAFGEDNIVQMDKFIEHRQWLMDNGWLRCEEDGDNV